MKTYSVYEENAQDCAICQNEREFDNKEAAMAYAKAQTPEVGFYVLCEEFDDEECVNTHLFQSDTNVGASVEGAIILQFSHQTYLNYAYKFIDVRRGRVGEMAADLLNRDKTYVVNEAVLLTAAEVEGLEGEVLNAKVDQELEAWTAKWTNGWDVENFNL